LHLWNYDRSMTDALEVAKMFLLPVDTLTAMFPCQGEVTQFPSSWTTPDHVPLAMEMLRDRLHDDLTKACIYSGLPPPAQPSTSPIQTPYHHPMHM